ncbi:MAG: YigZ family protein [Flavobacteriales bacterium]|nr:YigZ family protein [Flavobacteriales bacterium]MCB9363007.1 YigZ family protein [Flavobacteriales bacterium]
MADSYFTIKKPSEGIYKEKGSKFIAFAYPIYSEEDFKEHLSQLKKDYHDARHHCYAFKIGLTENEYRYSDDGEPNNSAGKPIYGQLLSSNITNVAIIVIRYFGGTKLGVGGLITAYKEAAKDAITNAKIVKRTVNHYYKIKFDYPVMSDVMNFIKLNNLNVTNQVFENSCLIEFNIRTQEAEQIINELEKIEDVRIEFVRTI